jgi:hypothetical protein
MLGLDKRVDIIFESDIGHFLLTLPPPWECPASKEFLGCFGMTGIKREWMPGFKAYRFGSDSFYDVCELLPDFFKRGEDDYGLDNCRPAGSLTDIQSSRKRQAEGYVP